MIKVMLVDDHPVVREGLVSMLSSQDDMQVVAEVGSGKEAVGLWGEHKPDVTVVDLHLGDMSGDQVIRLVKEQAPDAKFLVLTAYDTDDRIVTAIRAGAQGYLIKGTPKQQIFDAIRTVNNGGSLLGPGLAPKLLGIVEALGGTSSERLSQRELEVLKLAADGLRNKEIAGVLSIAERTVKYHLTTIYQKLGATNRTEAIREASRQGIISL